MKPNANKVTAQTAAPLKTVAKTEKADPKAEAALAKAAQKTLDMAAEEKKLADKKAADKIAKGEAAAKAKAEKEAEAASKKAAKDAAAKEKAEAKVKEAALKAALKAEAAEKQEAALAEIAGLTEKVEAAKTALKTASDTLAAAKRAARVPVAGDGSTAMLRARAPSYIHDTEHKTQSGNASVHCGDATAQKLLGKTLDEVYAIAAKITEEEESALREKYGHLNTGMQRMNLGNKIRGVLNAK